MDFFIFNGVWVFKFGVWKFMCSKCMANFPGNLQKFQTYWSLPKKFKNHCFRTTHDIIILRLILHFDFYLFLNVAKLIWNLLLQHACY